MFSRVVILDLVSKLTLVGLMLICLMPRTVLADNAVPIAVEETDEWRILFFSHESPLRAGLVELSVMLLDRDSGDPLTDWKITGAIEAETLREGNAWVSPCCRIDARGAADGNSVPLKFQRSRGGNVFAQEATTILPKPGLWKIEVEVTVPGRALVRKRVVMEVSRPRAPLEVYWAWFAAIPIAIGAYAWSRK